MGNISNRVEYTQAEKEARLKIYKKSIESVMDQVERVKKTARYANTYNGLPHTAMRIIRAAAHYDLQKNEELDLFFMYEDEGISQDFDNPEYYDHASVKGDNGPDNPKKPLEDGEQWNKGRRATLTGVEYKLDEDGYPINPYQKRGMRGRGMFWRYGPSIAVDNGAVKFKDGRLHVTGIVRGDSKLPGFAGGYANLQKNEDGEYYIDQEAIIDSQVMEFFEEMVSGSVPLEANAQEVEDAYQARLKTFEEKSKKPASEYDQERIRGQVETHFKFEQVKAKDLEFLERLRNVIAQGQECYRGPVLNDNRGTDTSWCESILTWYNFDDEVWDWVRRGDNDQDPIYPYEFAAGDDAAGLVLHNINPEFIETACASHGPMAAIMLASYVLDAVEKGATVHNTDFRFIDQLIQIATFLERKAGLDMYIPSPRTGVDFFKKNDDQAQPKNRPQKRSQLRL